MQDLWNLVLHNCIVNFDSEKSFLKTSNNHLPSFKNKEVTTHPKSQPLEKNPNSKPYTLNTKFTLNQWPYTLTLNLKFQP